MHIQNEPFNCVKLLDDSLSQYSKLLFTLDYSLPCVHALDLGYLYTCGQAFCYQCFCYGPGLTNTINSSNNHYARHNAILLSIPTKHDTYFHKAAYYTSASIYDKKRVPLIK